MEEIKTKTSKTDERFCQKFFVFFKSLLFVACLCGFIYQTSQYVKFYLEYNTTIDYRVENDRDFIIPAITFCDSNPIVRSKFCNKFPDRCEYCDVNDGICKMYPHYCKGNGTIFQVPRWEWIFNSTEIPIKDLKVLKHNRSSLLRYHNPEYEDNYVGPYYYYDNGSRQNFACYTYNSRADSNQDAYKRRIEPRNKGGKNIKLNILSFVVQPNELFDPWTEPGILFQIHSPFSQVNPTYDGIFLKPRKTYEIGIQLMEERLLPAPYESDCLNYTEIWERRNRTGPRSQRMCVSYCSMLYFTECFGCSTTMNLYPNPNKCERITVRNISCTERLFPEYTECKTSCKLECIKLKYQYKVQEGKAEALFYKEFTEKETIKVIVFLSEPEVIVRTHKPQFQQVEFFSYLGGFLGYWLGVSLFTFGNNIEKAFTFTERWWHRWNARKKTLVL